MEYVDAYIYQPRLDRWYKLPVHLRTPVDVVSYVESLEIQTLMRTGLELNPSAEACEYCPALKHCPAVGIQGRELDRASGVDVMDSRELGKLANMAKLATKQAELVLEETKARLIKGEVIPGWRLQERKTVALIQEKGITG
jgi:N-acetylneuraminic acid mutarotase